ncbi:transcriptional regulator [Microbacterium lacticum]|uniref:Diacylglycerol kinase family enzyme n=1 Tax=Microbacterium lacticum TaxID=33885 RepID=A0A4Y3USY9_9MICO|nr:diacylglycerol kinase family protein [Microbacterium lacticum]MBF9336697.1 transcriptional regulator [Microbacterium lacticum]TQM97958.1 diacylglycerol kinase family enzyme [Microbacterium lacticum]GEB96490.1 sphingosine kinase [Microbacterium lacticum]GGI74918.1 sphingosine kinase [Microbacterium lacticum]
MHTRRAAVVYNPVKVPLDRARRAVQEQERVHGWGESRWYETSSDDSGRRAAEEALAGDPTVVIVAGGDGTVRTVAEAVYETGTPLALLPAGTGNLLARNLGLPLNDVEGSVAAAFTGETRGVDVAVAELEDEDGTRRTRTFLVMAGIGLDAEMAENTNALAKKRLGWMAYVAPIARSVIANQLFHLDYRVDGGRTRSAHAHTVIVGNCGTLTGNMLLIPTAKVDDGLLDVVMLRPKGRFGWAGIGTRLTLQGVAHRSRLGRRMIRLAPDLQALAYAQGRRFEAHFETPHGIELDGDSFGLVVRARITVRPGALQICIGDGGD